MTTQIETLIAESVHRLTQHPSFITWQESDPASPGDILLINNSFVFRDVKTKKADEYLSLIVKDTPTEPDITIAHGVRFNVDFKRMALRFD